MNITLFIIKCKYTHISVYIHKLIYSIWMVLKFLGVREVIRKKMSKKAPKGNKNRLRNTALQIQPLSSFFEDCQSKHMFEDNRCLVS